LNKYSAPVATYGTRRGENIEDPSYLQFLRSDLLKCIPRTRIEHVEQRLITERACFTGTWRRRLHVITPRKMEIGLNAPCRRLIGPGRYKRRIQVPSDIGSGKIPRNSIQGKTTHPSHAMSNPTAPRSVPTLLNPPSGSAPAFFIIASNPTRPHRSAADIRTCWAGVCGW